MKSVFGDWRNVALGAAILGILVMAIYQYTTPHAGTDGGKVLVKISDRSITEDQVITEMRKRIGDQVFMDMIARHLMESFAAQQKVVVTDAEIDQVINYQKFMMESQGQDFDKLMKDQGLTMADLREQVKPNVIQVKLVVPPDRIAKEFAKMDKATLARLTYPARYSMQQFIYTKGSDADEALVLFRKGGDDNFTKAIAKAYNPEEAKKPQMYAPMPGREMPSMTKLLKGMKDGEYSSPQPYPGMPQVRYIIHLIKAYPAENPTVTNRNILIGQYLIGKDQNLAVKQRDLEATALKKVAVTFFPPADTEYKKAYDRFYKTKIENPLIDTTSPITPGGTSTPSPTTPSPAPPTGNK